MQGSWRDSGATTQGPTVSLRPGPIEPAASEDIVEAVLQWGMQEHQTEKWLYMVK